VELRCGAKKHGELIAEGTLLEVKCSSRFCGHQPGTVVLHRFDVVTGELVESAQFKDPNRKEKGNASRDSSSVRTA